MKKQSLRKLLAMLLCLSMVFSLLPAGALATEQGENQLGPPINSSEVSEELEEGSATGDTEDDALTDGTEDGVLTGDTGDDVLTDGTEDGALTGDTGDDALIDGTEDGALTGDTGDDVLTDGTEDDTLETDQRATDVPEDGALADIWTQDLATVKGDGSVCAVEDGKLHLKAGSGNANNGDAYPATGPAVFISEEMTNKLQAIDGVYTVTMNVTPLVDGICFGIYVNYQNPNAGMFVGYNTPGAWFWQRYGGDGAWSSGTLPGPTTLAKNTTYPVEITWSETGNTFTFKMDGTAVVENYDYSSVVEKIGRINNIGIKLGKSNAGVLGEVLISDIHYSGQAETTVYDVKGTVTETDGNAAVEGATVTIGGKTATTDASGAYTITGLVAGDYTGTVTKEGYKDGTIASFTVSGDITDKNVSLVEIKTHDVPGTVKDTENTPIAGATVTAGDQSTVTDAAGAYTLTLAVDEEYDLTVNKSGYAEYTGKLTVAANGTATGADVVLQARDDIATISTDAMDVVVSKNFPQVIQYTMKGGDLEGKIMYGQTETLDTIQIRTLNDSKQSLNVNVSPTVKSFTVEGGTARYVLTVLDEEKHIDADIYAELVADGNVLTFQITKIDSRMDRLAYPVQSIYIPDHSLVSIRGTEAEDGNLMAAKLAANTITKGDTYKTVDQAASVNNARYMYAFVSSNGLTAGISSNSQIGTSAAARDNNRITVSGGTMTDGSTNTIGLGSSQWYFDRYVGDSYSNTLHIERIPEDLRVVGPSGEEMPFYAKVVITGNKNNDAVVDWQDGAIAARDQNIIHKPYRGEEVRDVMGTRIAMNFGSHAQNPFLTTLDNVKRVALNTDGLGQAILLKGYANEGHDSGHPDFWDIGKRMGGPADMNAMMKEGEEYGAQFGIHVNTSEFYPEAKAFSEDALFWNPDGSMKYGWEWIDQGIGMNGIYDLAMGYRRDRFDQLKDLVGDNLDFIYVDVWGNNTSGSEDAWQTRKLSMDMTENDWRVVHEWGYANEWDSTFQHWVSDYGYGGYDNKGIYNSEVMRFMLNGYKDTWAPDFPNYGGNANAPLLGGPVMQGFEGWQGDGEYDEAMEAIFEHLIPTKFLQHYDIMKWEDATDAVQIPYSESGGSNAATLSSWTPETQITLQNADRKSTVVVTRGSDETINDTYAYGTDDARKEYRSRTITLDGKVILRGAAAPAAGTTAYSNSLRAFADQQYLIPWLWDKDGNALAADDQKLYHRNDVAGVSTWELPDSWANLANVKMYELTDNGRVNETVVTVEDGSVTLNAEAKVPYVIVKGENGAAAPTVVWSTGMHLTDVSFNGIDVMDSWNIEGSGEAARYATARQIPMLKLTGEVSVNQKMTDLTPGKQYAVYVGVDNRSTSNAYMSITVNGKEVAHNYAGRSIAKNYVSAYAHHNGMPVESGNSYFQNMQVFFTAPSSGEVVLKLGREAGTGNTYFDDVRVVENTSKNGVYDSNFNLISFTQDFENVAAGLYPFVVAGIENVADNRQHLSERNGVYTQAGWDSGIKRLDDVISGDWSLKVNGKAGANYLTFQTLPQTVRFAPGVTYEISFDYEMGTTGAYSLVYGVGEYTGVTGLNKVELLSAKDGKVGHCTFTITGDPSGQSWFGIYSDSMLTKDAPKNSDLNNFVLDNLSIKRSGVDKSKLVELVAQAASMSQGDYTGDWTALQTALRFARIILDDPNVSQRDVDDRANALESAIKALVKNNAILTGTVTLDGKPVEGAKIIVMNATFSDVDSAVTGTDGKYSFENLGGGDYYLKTTATGCDLKTINVSGLSNGTNTKNIELTAHTPAPYEFTFEDGDTSMMEGLTEADTTFSLEPVQHNGNGAMKITFTGNRTTNNVVFKGVQMKNGTFSYDVTPLKTGSRFGADVRANALNSRAFVGTFDNNAIGACEYWFEGANNYPSGTAGPALAVNVTRHVEITVKNQLYTMKFDGVTVFESELSAAPNAAGYLGFVYGNGSGAATASFIIDNVSIAPDFDEIPDAGYAVTGTVTAGTTGVFGAQVTIKDSSNAVVVRTTTDLAGGYTAKLADGSYTIEVVAAGYTAKTGSVTVSGAAVTADAISLTVDKTQLETLYNNNKDKLNEDYTVESWKAFTDALTAAKAALDDANSSQSAISKAFNDLSNALSGLVGEPLAPVNKAALRTYYNTFNSYIKSDFKETGWDAFVAALQAAAVVLKDTQATQTQIDAAKDALVAAESALEKISQGGGGTGGGDTGGGGGTGGGDTGGGGGGTSGGGGGTTSGGSSTTTNPDGTTTKTETNKNTGTVTETTTGTDGTKVVTETKKDGTSTTVVTLPKKPQGTVTLPGKPASSGDTITVKTDNAADVVIPVKNVKPGIVPIIIKADGTEVIVTKSVTNADGVALTIDGSAVIQLRDNSKSFGDVATSHWAGDAITFATSRELFQGVGGDSFSPTGNMTRSMLITVLARLDGQETAGGNTWYSKAMDWGKETGITDGTNVDASITRESLVVMLYRYAKAEKVDGMALSEFSDAGQVSGWANEAISWAVANGILNGAGGKLNPSATASRAEVATMLMRFVSL